MKKFFIELIDFFNYIAHLESQRYAKKYTPYKTLAPVTRTGSKGETPDANTHG